MKNAKKFEENLKELEKLALELEKEDLSLEDALSSFEKGIALAKVCNKELENAEKKINILLQNKDGNLEEQNFIQED